MLEVYIILFFPTQQRSGHNLVEHVEESRAEVSMKKKKKKSCPLLVQHTAVDSATSHSAVSNFMFRAADPAVTSLTVP